MTLFAPAQHRHRPLLEDCKPWCEEVVAPDILSLRTSLWPVDQRTRWDKYWDTFRTLQPVAQRYYDFSEFSRMVRCLTGDTPDLIWVYSSWLTGYLPHLDWQRVVVDFDALFFRAMRRAMRHPPGYGSKYFFGISRSRSRNVSTGAHVSEPRRCWSAPKRTAGFLGMTMCECAPASEAPCRRGRGSSPTAIYRQDGL